jgi:Zn-dependent protease with chaperone function
MIIAIPVWWSLFLVLSKSDNAFSFIAAAPGCFLILPLSMSVLIARLITYRSSAYVFGRQWTARDILRLASWRTGSSTLALLFVATALEDIYSKKLIGFAWMFGAGVAALIGKVQLNAAEGLTPRPVKSGELYKRSLVMSKRMGVALRRVCVVPFGRGKLTNAYGGWAQIAVTDDYGHWLHGSQLDFVIGHELSHAKHKDAVKTLVAVAGMFFAVGAATFVLPPHMPVSWKIAFNFGVILLPLISFYALSRHHEYVADRSAVETTGEPEFAIRALVSLYHHSEVPAEQSRLVELFSTHPALWRRVAAIARVGRVPPEYISDIRARFMDSAADGRS